MASKPLEYWQPGSEERKLRIFISHRYDKDQTLYDDVIRSLNGNQAVQDVSLSATQLLSGPRGGELPELKIQAEIAARIYSADILIAPSRPGAGRSEWVTWEVQLAAVGYGIPVLFVDEEDTQRRQLIVSQVAALGLPHAICAPSTPEIVRNIVQLAGHPKWGVRESEPDAAFQFRGPPRIARDDVMKKFPFEARLAAVEQGAAPKRGFWPFGARD